MIADNLDYTTLVKDEKYNNIEGLEYVTVDWEKNGKTYSYTFVQCDKNPKFEGIVPSILKRLWSERKKIKRQMAQEKDPVLKSILNGKQLAMKISMNSIYGFTGAEVGMLPCKPIAASTTTQGRKMIEHSKKCAEKWYDCTTVYGDTDSIYCKFNVPEIKDEQEKMKKDIWDFSRMCG